MLKWAVDSDGAAADDATSGSARDPNACASPPLPAAPGGDDNSIGDPQYFGDFRAELLFDYSGGVPSRHAAAAPPPLPPPARRHPPPPVLLSCPPGLNLQASKSLDAAADWHGQPLAPP